MPLKTFSALSSTTSFFLPLGILNSPQNLSKLRGSLHLEPFCLFPGKDLVVLARFIRAGISREVHAVKHFVRRLGFFWKIIRRHGFGGVEDKLGFHGTFFQAIVAVSGGVQM